MNPILQCCLKSTQHHDPTLKNHFLNSINQHPHLEFQDAYHLEYCKMYIQTIQLDKMVAALTIQIANIHQEIETLESTMKKSPKRARLPLASQSHNSGSNSEARKRLRRTANSITRHYVCPMANCDKSYGSEGSLNQHIKLKHTNICHKASADREQKMNTTEDQAVDKDLTKKEANVKISGDD